jgi:hypothetical protein
MSRSYKLAWEPGGSHFVLDSEPLSDLIKRLVQQFLSQN